MPLGRQITLDRKQRGKCDYAGKCVEQCDHAGICGTYATETHPEAHPENTAHPGIDVRVIRIDHLD